MVDRCKERLRGVMLSDIEIEAYRRDGIVVPSFQLSASRLRAMHAALDQLLASNPENSSDSMLCPHLIFDAAQDVPGMHPLRGTPAWLEFARDPAILDMVEQLIGPDLILWGTTVFGKPAERGTETPWHQDGDYWPIRPRATCSVWIALDESTQDNGCLRVIPGSHTGGRIYRHHRVQGRKTTLAWEADGEQFEDRAARDIVLKPGQMSLHDVNLLHGSRANTSARRRAGFALRIMPANAHFDHALGQRNYDSGRDRINYGRRALYQLRGRDTCGRNDMTVGHAENRAPRAA